MKGKGLNLQMIVDTASKLIVEKGYDNFSVRELAVRLNVKAASLYNHISGVGDINREVAMLAVSKLNQALSEAIAGKARDEAFMALALAYRQFYKDNSELYRAVMGLPVLDSDGEMREIGKVSLDAIHTVISQYSLPEKTSIDYFRSLRSALHGFVSLESGGFFSLKSVDVNESYIFMINGCIERIRNLEQENLENL